MPLPPSTTTFRGPPLRERIVSGSMKRSAAAWNSSYRSTSSTLPVPVPVVPSAGAADAPPSSASISRRMSWMPSSPDSAIAPSRTSFAPVYALGLCEAVHISPPSSSREPTRK